MQIRKISRVEATSARGVVIVIDVLRAFSVAAYAFAGGARSIWLVRAVEEALALRERVPEALLAGEVGGRLIPGFDFNNSPSRMAVADVRDRLLIQRTGAGTQGAVNARQADALLVCSLTNARATAVYARTCAETVGEAGERAGLITLFPTERVEGLARNEDHVCADYLEALLLERPDAQVALARDIAYLHAAGRFERFTPGDADMPFEDVAAVLAVDRFPFALVGIRRHWHDIEYIEVRRVDPAM